MRTRPRIAILWGSTGYGHRASAESISEAIVSRSPDAHVIVKDVVEFLPTVQQHAIKLSWQYGSKYAPVMLETLRRFLTNSLLGSRLARALISLGNDSFSRFCDENNFDIIVSTHPVATILSSLTKRRHGYSIFAVATDFSIHRLSSSEEVSSIFVSPLVLSYGKGGETLENVKIVDAGIPISKEYSYKTPGHDAKQKLGFSPNSPLVLVSFGGSGIGAMDSVSRIISIVHQFKDTQFVIVCGADLTAKVKFQKALNHHIKVGRVQVYGFVANFYSLASASDVYLGKAGGVTLSEIISLCIPIGVLGPVRGIEKDNVSVLEESGLGVDIRKYEQLEAWLGNLLPNMETDVRREAIPNRYGRPHSSTNVCDYIFRAIPQT